MSFALLLLWSARKAKSIETAEAPRVTRKIAKNFASVAREKGIAIVVENARGEGEEKVAVEREEAVVNVEDQRARREIVR